MLLFLSLHDSSRIDQWQSIRATSFPPLIPGMHRHSGLLVHGWWDDRRSAAKSTKYNAIKTRSHERNKSNRFTGRLVAEQEADGAAASGEEGVSCLDTEAYPPARIPSLRCWSLEARPPPPRLPGFFLRIILFVLIFNYFKNWRLYDFFKLIPPRR